MPTEETREAVLDALRDLHDADHDPSTRQVARHTEYHVETVREALHQSQEADSRPDIQRPTRKRWYPTD